MSEKLKKGISRRQFLTRAAVGMTAVAGSAVIASCAPQVVETAVVEGEAAATLPSFLTPPAPIADADIAETVAGDIVVVGAGVSGLMAAWTAAKAGAKTILLEKSESYNARGGHNGALRSKIQLEEGLDYDVDKAARELIRWSSNKVNSEQVFQWAHRHSAIMDELIDLAQSKGIEIMRWGNDVPDEYWPEYKSVHMFGGMDEKILAGMFEEEARAAGAEFRYSTPAVQLVKEGDRVAGVIGQKADGTYVRFDAARAVILAAGDYGNDPEMVQYYCPKAALVDTNVYAPPVNTGDGIKLGLWAGAAVQPEEPHTPMVHNLGAAPFSGNPFLRVNIFGKRYENEDVPIPTMANSQQLQPQHKTWTIYDSTYAEDLPQHGLSFSRSNGATEMTQTSIDAALEAGGLQMADTIEELAGKIGVPADALKATVDRYNELAAAGKDEDFGKDPAKLNAIDTAPFYAAYNSLALLVVLGGLNVNGDLQVLDAEGKVIPGLYASGNNAGGFFANDYPVIIPGLSHCRAWTQGRIVAENALKS